MTGKPSPLPTPNQPLPSVALASLAKPQTAIDRDEKRRLAFSLQIVKRLPPAVPPDEPKLVPSRVIYEAYESWCLANAMKPWSEKAFSQTMVKKGFVKIDGRIRYFINLRLHDLPERPEPRNPHREDDR